jgi:serine/threonine-protein kinase RsbW
MYTAVTPNEKKTVYLPDSYHQYAHDIYNNLGFQRDIVLSDTSIKKSDTKLGKTNVVVRHDHNQAFIIVEEYGRDTLVEINFLVREMCMNRIDCIYLDLPIFKELSSYVATKLKETGFFFGGILPELRNGDVLRLQYLNNVEILKNDIKTASDFGSKLLNYVIEDMEEVELNSLLSAS